ncbi:TonB-dependent receptor [Mucilaginibacter limnophilus]|uniref:TonB-dependent receptor n=1 Tax=Mucilaginibacter limnophilus TaxID=1932778 RepID=A0A3S2VK19_9SPHI|nr:outer membrane beta-barrel protein [Mucilaginibacter limnophilus]RVT97197.1 TonB-dependent receptor [Mucilaginibacter limnophilus]
MSKILLFMLLLVSIASQAQKHASIAGRVLDSLENEPLEFATVAVVNLQDSSIQTYTVTDKNGMFKLHRLPTGNQLKIVITYIGHNNFRKTINLFAGQELNLGRIYLSSKLLNEVVIKADSPPVVIRKDTIEFSAEAFKTRPNAVVEELLKKLPGTQVDRDGNITVNGKSVRKMTVDGKDFFGNDPRVASRNLDADLIDKVQVYDDREFDPDHLIEASKVNKIINLKLKKAVKKSVFGKVYSGLGSRDRFESGGLINMFRDTLQVSVIGLTNNLNRFAFSQNDLYTMGGFDRSGGNPLYDGTLSVGGGSRGIERVISSGFNINNDYGQKLKMNLMYFYGNTQNTNEIAIRTQQFLNDTTLLITSANRNVQTQNKHNLSGTIKWVPDTVNNFQYSPRLVITRNNSKSDNRGKRSNNLVLMLNESTNMNSENNTQNEFQHSFNYYRKLKKKGQTINISHSLNISPYSNQQYNNNILMLYNGMPQGDTVTTDLFIKRVTRNGSGNVDINYRYPFNKKLTGSINLKGNYDRLEETVLAYNKSAETGAYDELIETQSNQLKRNAWSRRINPGITYQFTKNLSVVFNLSALWQNIHNEFKNNIADVNQEFFNILPSVKVSGRDFSVSYDVSINQPNISDLQPVSIVYNPLYTFTGNPLLQPTRYHTANAQYFVYKYQSQISVNAYFNGTIEENAIVRKRIIDPKGAETATPINTNGQYKAQLGMAFGKRFKKTKNWQINLQIGLNTNFDRSFFLLNLDRGWQDRYFGGLNQRLSINWKDKVDLNSSYNFIQSLTKYKNAGYNNVNTANHNFNTALRFYFPKKVIWECDYSYSYNSQLAAGFRKSNNLLSAAVSVQMLKKDRGQLKLSVYDLLDQNISAYRYASGNSISDVQNTILKQYFLLTFQFKFNKTTTK